jgi:hypothetical protein
MALDQSSKIIPGIPLAALDAIADAGIRDVLRALISTHNVRNNLAGTGSEAFITTRQALLAARGGTSAVDPVAPRLLARYLSGAGGGSYGSGSLSGPLATMNVELDRTASFEIKVHWQVLGGGFGSNTRVEVHNGTGVVLLSRSDSGRSGYVRSHIATSVVTLEAGSYALTLHAGNDGGYGTATLVNWSMLLIPVAG